MRKWLEVLKDFLAFLFGMAQQVAGAANELVQGLCSVKIPLILKAFSTQKNQACWVKTCFFVGTCGDFCVSRSLLISLKKAWRRLFWGGGKAWSLALWCRKWSQPCRRRDFWFFHMPRFFRRRNLFLGGWGVGLKWSFFFFWGGGCQVFFWVTGDVGFVLPKKCVSNFWKGVWQQLFWSPFGGLQMMKSVHLFACDVYWVCPPPSNSHHQDYFIFSRGSQPKPLFATGILRPHPWHI